MNLFSNGVAMVKGIRLKFNQEIICEVSRLPLDGEIFEEDMNPFSTRAIFILHSNKLVEVDRKKGTRQIYVQEPYS